HARLPERRRRLRGIAVLYAGGFGGDGSLPDGRPEGLRRARRVRRELRDALPGRRPLPAPPRRRPPPPLHPARGRPPRRGRHARLPAPPPPPAALSRAVGRHG